MRIIFIFLCFGAATVLAKPTFNHAYDHIPGNAVPTISSVLVEYDGELVLNREVPANEKVKVQVFGDSLKKVGSVTISEHHSCIDPVKTPSFSVMANSNLYFEVSLPKYATSYYICLTPKKHEIANYKFTVGNEMDQILISKDAPFWKSTWFKCLMVGGIPCYIWF